ncbi:unnamed protein product [Owenia fusiformis]|nr:unnamed protein product [Owenia fusiformis]
MKFSAATTRKMKMLMRLAKRSLIWISLIGLAFFISTIIHQLSGANKLPSTSSITLKQPDRASIHQDTPKKSLDLPVIIKPKISKEDYQAAEDDMKYRKSHVEDTCKRLGKTGGQLSAVTLKHIVVDDKYKYLYCYIPKVASGSWLRLLLPLTYPNISIAQSDIQHREQVRKLSDYSPEERLFRLYNYLKFTFVRNPYERFQSAFANKFTEPKIESIRKSIGPTILRRYRKNPTEESLKTGEWVQFHEFVQYLIDPRTKSFNEHWDRFTSLCDPCNVNYDIIGKYETIVRDGNYMLSRINASATFTYKPYKSAQTTFKVKKAYGKVSPADFRSLGDTFQDDFDIFEYDKTRLTNTL